MGHLDRVVASKDGPPASQPSAEPLRLLIVEDDDNDAELLQLELARSGYQVDATRVDTEPQLRAALAERTWDLVVSDFSMPSFDGLRAFDMLRETGLDVPFLFVSGAIGEDRAVEAIRAGARDYLIKGRLERLGDIVRRELAQAHGRAARRHAEDADRRQHRRSSLALTASGDGVFDYGGDDAYFSEGWNEILGTREGALPSLDRFWDWLRERVHVDDVSAFESARDSFLEGASPRFRSAIRLRHETGRWVPVEIRAGRFGPEDGSSESHFVGTLRDLTDHAPGSA